MPFIECLYFGKNVIEILFTIDVLICINLACLILRFLPQLPALGPLIFPQLQLFGVKSAFQNSI
jgi:hypothetical protein